jgi:hypothetical protein
VYEVSIFFPHVVRTWELRTVAADVLAGYIADKAVVLPISGLADGRPWCVSIYGGDSEYNYGGLHFGRYWLNVQTRCSEYGTVSTDRFFTTAYIYTLDALLGLAS